MSWLRNLWSRMATNKRVQQHQAGQIVDWQNRCASLEVNMKRERARNDALGMQLVELAGNRGQVFGTFHGITEPAWDKDDADKLRQFLISPTGARLKAKLNYREQLVNRSAVHLQANHENASGYARGNYDAIQYVVVDLPVHVPPQEDAATQEQPGDAALRERLSP